MAFPSKHRIPDNSLYNEDRNLLRIQERQRRNQEALQEKDKFSENTPLFPEPYKTNKEDELSSRIQNMLGNYEDLQDLINDRCYQSLLGILEGIVPQVPQRKPDHSSFPEKTSCTLLSSFHHATRYPHTGPPVIAPPHPGHYASHQKAQPGTGPAPGWHAKSHSSSSNWSQGQEHKRGRPDSRAGSYHNRTDRHPAGGGHAPEPQATLLELSPLLPSLSSPVAPLSPLHSIQHTNSRSQSSSKGRGPTYAQSPQDRAADSRESKSQDNSAVTVAGTTQPSSQTFPPPLPSKTSAMQQKPTAYVRPMDGQEQAPVESPDLKPLLEEYHGEPYESISDLKANTKAKLSKLKISSEPTEQTLPSDSQCVEEILKEMTHSWPPLLTAIHTPSAAEPSKFPFPAKESQHVTSVAQNHKQYDASSKTSPSSHPTISVLQEDLQLSDSEESGDDQVVEPPPSSLDPPSALQSQPESVASAHSGSTESGSSSESNSSSDSSETESSSSDSDAKDPPRVSAPEPDPPTSNKWQLDNWLTKVNPPAVPTESPSNTTHADGHEEDKEQPVSNSSSREHAAPKEPHDRSSIQAAQAPQDVHLPTKLGCQKSPVHTEEPSQRQTVGIKGPSKPLVQEEPKGGLKVESEPAPYEIGEQSSRDKPKLKTKSRPKSCDQKELKPQLRDAPKEKKHKSSRHTKAKALPDHRPVRDVPVGSVQEPTCRHLPEGQGTAPTRTSGHRTAAEVKEGFHKEKLPVPIKEKLLPPVRNVPGKASLLVSIDLPLLSRVPQPPGKGDKKKRAEMKEHPDTKGQDLEKKSTDTPDKSLKKRKREKEKDIDRKKRKLGKEAKPSQSSQKKDSSKSKARNTSSETQNKDLRQPLSLPPVSPTHPAPKPTKVALKRPRSENSQPPATASTPAPDTSNHRDPPATKQKKMVETHSEQVKDDKGSVGDVTNPLPVPSLPNGTSKPRRPQIKFEKQHLAEYYLEEAKKMKHEADAMMDKTGKAFQYLDAALSFIEYGLALESNAVAPKPAYSIFADTIDLLKYVMTLKPFADVSASSHEHVFAVLCMRCQSLLHMAMFRYKRDTAKKYSRILNDHFKSSSRVTQAPSPCVARSTGMPSPHSPVPSPARSTSSQQGSNGSNGCGCNSIGSSVTIPSITSSYVNITSYVLSAYNIWEHADALSKNNKEFFAELSTAVCPLALTSSMTEMVHYTRQGLHWLRLNTSTP
ncbi:AF4/FMR2 family member 1 isoform X1 [Cyrtonyx montezumae]|uniref:AF4/FMR2 family member 1 isoform X1 n=1 Tax=Cyrtonyx montezumae TaxID=9017 RepID=UPI0032DA4C8F